MDSGDVVVIGVIVVSGVGVVVGVAVAEGDVDLDVDGLAPAAAVTREVADAVGFWDSPDAVPTTVSVTDVTEDAAGTVVCAWS